MHLESNNIFKLHMTPKKVHTHTHIFTYMHTYTHKHARTPAWKHVYNHTPQIHTHHTHTHYLTHPHTHTHRFTFLARSTSPQGRRLQKSMPVRGVPVGGSKIEASIIRYSTFRGQFCSKHSAENQSNWLLHFSSMLKNSPNALQQYAAYTSIFFRPKWKTSKTV